MPSNREALPSSVNLFGTSHAQRLQEVSRFWLGIGTKPPVQHLKQLMPAAVLEALEAGKSCQFQEWTLRCTPPKSVFSLTGEEQVVSSIWVASIHGFTSFTPVNQASVESACRYITQRELLVAERAREELALDQLH
jgi:hypothetical protein